MSFSVLGRRVLDPERFVAVMKHWSEFFLAGMDHPGLGASEVELRSLRVPGCVIPGNDRTQPGDVGWRAAELLTDAEMHEVPLRETTPRRPSCFERRPPPELSTLATAEALSRISCGACVTSNVGEFKRVGRLQGEDWR